LLIFNANAIGLLRQSQAERFPYLIQFAGLTIFVHAKVWSLKYFWGWLVYWKHMPPVQDKVILDMGTGTGITGVLCAKRGSRRVLALDVTRAAVLNARENALQNKCPQIEVRQSDLFQAVSARERFDLIYWHFPFLQVPASYRCKSNLEVALFDPGSNL
jgi:methylase of polypeptide subunit release factors